MGQRVTQLELKISTRVCFSIICYPLEGRFAYFPGRIYNQSLYTWMCPFFAVSKIQIVVRWPILSPTEKWNFCIDIVALIKKWFSEFRSSQSPQSHTSTQTACWVKINEFSNFTLVPYMLTVCYILPLHNVVLTIFYTYIRSFNLVHPTTSSIHECNLFSLGIAALFIFSRHSVSSLLTLSEKNLQFIVMTSLLVLNSILELLQCIITFSYLYSYGT